MKIYPDYVFAFKPPKALPSKAESVKVVVRCRPMDEKEKVAGHER